MENFKKLFEGDCEEKSGRLEKIKVLLGSIDVNSKMPGESETYFQYALEHGDMDFISLFLRSGEINSNELSAVMRNSRKDVQDFIMEFHVLKCCGFF